MIPPPHDQDTERLLRAAIQEHREAVMTITDTERELRRWQSTRKRHHDRQRALLAVAASVALLAAGGAYALLSTGDGEPRESSVAAPRDLRDGETLAATALPGGAQSVDLLGDELYVATGRALSVLDADGSEVLRQVPVDKGDLMGPVVRVGDGAWMPYFDGEKDLYARVDLAAGRITATADVGRSYWIAAGGAGLWAIASGDDVVRLDPTTGAELQRVTLPFRPFGLLVGERTVWVKAASGGAIARVDATTGAITPGPDLGGSAPGVLVDEQVWVIDPTTAELLRIDEQGGIRRTTLPGAQPGRERETGYMIATDGRSLYVTSARDGQRLLFRVDVTDGRVLDAVRLPNGPQPHLVDGAGDSVLLASIGGTELLRLDLR